MESATTEWAGLLAPVKSRKSRASRHRPRGAFRRLVGLFSKLALGLMLVGCSTMPGLRLGQSRDQAPAVAGADKTDTNTSSTWIKNPFKKKEKVDPLVVLQTGVKGKERIEAYRELGKPELVSKEMRALSRKLLIEGATSEYSVLARSAAIHSLAAYDEADVTETLLKATEDRSAMIRVEAVEALKNRTGDEIAKTIRNMAVADTDADVRIAATRILASSKDRNPTVINTLVDCLKDDELAVVDCAATGLRDMTGADIKTAKYQEWRSWVDNHPNLENIPATARKEAPASIFNIFKR
ncbi:HEAT repeat domain-containing protein [bacterium]|nr:HEAT repeat domain-containing protein [bacterium]